MNKNVRNPLVDIMIGTKDNSNAPDKVGTKVEPTPLEALDKILNQNTLSVPERKVISFREKYKEEVDIIETALKENTELKRQNFNLLCNNGELREKCKDNAKKLKALDIIICKKVDCDFLDDEWAEENYEYALENYNLNHDIELTRKEYNLLKECFK